MVRKIKVVDIQSDAATYEDILTSCDTVDDATKQANEHIEEPAPENASEPLNVDETKNVVSPTKAVAKSSGRKPSPIVECEMCKKKMTLKNYKYAHKYACPVLVSERAADNILATCADAKEKEKDKEKEYDTETPNESEVSTDPSPLRTPSPAPSPLPKPKPNPKSKPQSKVEVKQNAEAKQKPTHETKNLASRPLGACSYPTEPVVMKPIREQKQPPVKTKPEAVPPLQLRKSRVAEREALYSKLVLNALP